MTSSFDPRESGNEGRAATHGQAQVSAAASGQPLREPLTVTALFEDRAAVVRAVDALYSAGTPRDLVEVVVSRAAAERYYADAERGIRRPGRETFRYAGIGGLFGFIVGVLLGLVMVALPGIQEAGSMALVQVFGPNIATIGGAAIGAIVGFLRRQRPNPRHARAAEESGAIVLAAATRSREEAHVLGVIMSAHGGHDLRVQDG
jgi:hypothetical protein